MEISVLDKLIKEFLYYSEFGQGKSSNSIKSLKKDLEQFKDYIGENNEIESLDEIDPIFIRGLTLSYQKDKIGKRSINRKHSSLRVFFKYLKKNGIIKRDISALITSPSFEAEEPDVLSRDEIEKLRDAISLKNWSGIRDRAMLEVLYSTGITSQELLSLGENVIDMEKREMKIGNSKGSRTVFFSERAKEYLKRYLGAKKIKHGERYSADVVFVNGSAKRLSDRSLRRIVDRYADRAGIEREISPYSLRHTFIAHMLLNGMNIHYVKELTGYSAIESLRNYQDLIKKPKIVERIMSWKKSEQQQ